MECNNRAVQARLEITEAPIKTPQLVGEVA